MKTNLDMVTSRRKELLELIMSIAGTVIAEKRNGKWVFTHKASLFIESKNVEDYYWK